MCVHEVNESYIILNIIHNKNVLLVLMIIYLSFFIFFLRLESCSFGLKQVCVLSLCEDSQGQKKKKKQNFWIDCEVQQNVLLLYSRPTFICGV